MNWELPMNWELSARSRRRLARAAYRVGGWLVHVKTYQREYKLAPPTGPDQDLVFIPVGRSWQSIGWAWDLLEQSERLDPEHWEHWAVDHSAPPVDGTVCPRCPVCGGGTCGDGPGDAWGHMSPVTESGVTGDG